MLRDRLAVAFGMAAGVLAVGVAASLLVHWIIPIEDFAWVRRLGLVRIAYSAALFAAWGLAELAITLRAVGDGRAAGLVALAIAMLVQGTVSAAAFDPIGGWLVYAGVLGTASAAFVLSRVQRPALSALAGGAGGLLVFALGWLGLQPFI